MKAPERIQRLCLAYRALFRSDAEMAKALGVGLARGCAIVNGDAYPSLEVMIVIQAALRKAAADEEKGPRAPVEVGVAVLLQTNSSLAPFYFFGASIAF